jgi:cytochrome o ubiquinol oxidase subunit 3
MELTDKPLITQKEHYKHVAETDHSKTMVGFWVYLMTDCVLFASLFAVFAVLRNSTNGGPGGAELFNLPFVLVETLILLTSSFVCGLVLLAAQRKARTYVVAALVVVFLLGLSFIALELTEFRHLVQEGNSWRRSGFLSAFFTLVGTHGLHITVGLLWMIVMIVQIARKGLIDPVLRRLSLFAMFWHFLDVVWIFIFSLVYLLGATS